MKLLITGGAGFIGSNFISMMLDSNEDMEITNVDRLSFGSNLKSLEGYRTSRRYSFVRSDITDTSSMTGLVEQADCIINFAAESHVDRSIADARPFLKSNIEGVMTLLDRVRKSAGNKRLVQISTDEVYGDFVTGSANEDTPLRPSSPYAATKAAADLLCLAYHRTYGLDVVITRCTNNFGRFQFPEKLIPKLIIRASLGLKLPIYGRGENIRDWIFVRDHCNGIEAVRSRGRAGQVYNIAGKNELQNIEIVSAILDAMGKSRDLIEYVEDRPGHDMRYSLDDAKIRSELGWKPAHTFANALNETVSWYLTHESWWKDIADESVLSPSPWKSAS